MNECFSKEKMVCLSNLSSKYTVSCCSL